MRGTVLVLAILFCFAGIAAGTMLTRDAVPDWYASLQKPGWTPPTWLFGPVWTALYVLMALAAYLVYRRLGWPEAYLPLLAFAVQLLLNAAWTPLFFGLHELGWALAEGLCLLAAILVTMVLFWRAAPAAGLMLVPYAVWVAYAMALNFAIWRLNA